MDNFSPRVGNSFYQNFNEDLRPRVDNSLYQIFNPHVRNALHE